MPINKVPTVKNKVDEFALPGDKMFTNTVIIRVAKEKEVFFDTLSGKTHVGFVTGLDHEWIAITTTFEQRLVLINIVNIEAWGETGRSLEKTKLSDDPQEDETIKMQIRTYSYTVYNKARTIFKEKQDARKTSKNSNGYDNWDYEEDVVPAIS